MSTNNHTNTWVTDTSRVPLRHRCASELESRSTTNFSIKYNSRTIQFNREDIPVNSSERKQVEDKRQPSHPELKLSEVPPAGAHCGVRCESALCALLTAHIPPSSSSSSALSRSSGAAGVRAQTYCATRLTQSHGRGRHRHCEGVQTGFWFMKILISRPF